MDMHPLLEHILLAMSGVSLLLCAFPLRTLQRKSGGYQGKGAWGMLCIAWIGRATLAAGACVSCLLECPTLRCLHGACSDTSLTPLTCRALTETVNCVFCNYAGALSAFTSAREQVRPVQLLPLADCPVQDWPGLLRRAH